MEEDMQQMHILNLVCKQEDNKNEEDAKYNNIGSTDTF